MGERGLKMEAAQIVPLLQVGPCWALGWRPLTYDQEGQVDGFGSGVSRLGLRDRGSRESSKGITHAHRRL